ncbi:RES domain-containing protein [Arthrobacter sp. efr-133-TYG-104]|uniref:RES domain-containing protein n=1 Tax=Arthrobacter sp. efr-133-TYG-104 TaxID=3040324 RepID=UPI00254D81C1|nr:RES domain-containing protein [Arthrobacter sp. efr-133-TYG-104]
MTAALAERLCEATGLHLLEARGESAFRVAKDRYGALSVLPNAVVGPLPVGADPGEGDHRGRFDAKGRTIYLADSRECAYAEVLVQFRRERAKIAKVAESINWEVNDYISQVAAEAESNGVDVPWAISVDWQMERSVYEIQLPRNGWWVQIDHAETLLALEGLAPKTPGLTDRLHLLTSDAVEGEDRDLTTLLAHVLRGVSLDDGSRPLGISYRSKTLKGRCWAYWDRRSDEGLPPVSNDLLQVSSKNVGPDPEFVRVARFYKLPILGARR